MKLVLKNYKECGFTDRPYINKLENVEVYTSNFYCRSFGRYDHTFHNSLKAAKAFIRRENSTRNTPRFIWVEES